MQPIRQTLAAAFPVSGITTRTTNQSEQDTHTAKLAAHWGRVFCRRAVRQNTRPPAGLGHVWGVFGLRV